MMKKLLLEIQTEEIPAGYIEPALEALAGYLEKALESARVDHGQAILMGTPRRLAVLLSDIAERQRPLRAEMSGPPESVAFDAAGNPLVAAVKFAEKAGVPVGALGIKETPKGRYLYAMKTEKGLSTRILLKSMLPDAIAAIPFPKTMRWADRKISFARPIHAILALLGDSVITFQLDTLKSGRYTIGHRFASDGRMKIADTDRYVDALRMGHVLVDIAERRTRIETEIARAARKLNGTVLEDRELVETVKNLVEYPAVVAGRFDHKFLELPRDILITAMREHQKYFAVVDKHNDLMPYFIAVNNTPAKDMALVAKGHERVLRARLEDARFFFKTDLNTPLSRWAQKLHGVLFQAQLGSMHEKVKRVEQLSGYLSDAVSAGPGVRQDAVRAAQLCKLDLVSQVVGEFPKLQGVMGRIYAAAAGETEAAAIAVEEHYRPTSSGASLPDTLAGAILGIADKMDTICGCFSIGLVPTGGSDPYALRRQGIGMIQTILHKKFSFSLRHLIDKGVRCFTGGGDDHRETVAEEVYRFLRNRMVQLLTDEGYAKDLVSAVVSVSADDVPNVWRRAQALSLLKAEAGFEPLAIAFKRVVNIIRQAKEKSQHSVDEAVTEELFEDACEADLFAAYRAVDQIVAENLKNGRFDQALHHISSLRGTVDAFFDGVMVLTEDRARRRNRLALLNRIAGLFETVADFSKIST